MHKLLSRRSLGLFGLGLAVFWGVTAWAAPAANSFALDEGTVMLSRLQFAFTVSFHIIFPSFTIGLAAWLACLETLWQRTGNVFYRRLFEFWIKIFGIAFGMGVVFGIVMAFQFGTNWSVLSERSGNIMGPLLAYETFTAFMLEATFLGVIFLGRNRIPRWAYLISCYIVAIGTTLSAYWIMVNNTWMQIPTGYRMEGELFIATSWTEIMFNEMILMRFAHMLLGAYLTTAMIVASVGAWCMLRQRYLPESRIMINMGLGLAAFLLPVQLVVGHLNGKNVNEYQPAKLAAIEARWETQKEASLVLFAIPDEAGEKNLFSIEIPKIGSLIDDDNIDAIEPGLKSFAKEDRPPVLLPFLTFRIMFAMWAVMMLVAWVGIFMRMRGKLIDRPWFLRLIVWSFPTGWIAVVTGWLTAEIGRQPWVIYNYLRTFDAHSPLLFSELVISMIAFILVYIIVAGSGFYFMFRLVKEGIPQLNYQLDPQEADGMDVWESGRRPLAVPETRPSPSHGTE